MLLISSAHFKKTGCLGWHRLECLSSTCRLWDTSTSSVLWSRGRCRKRKLHFHRLRSRTWQKTSDRWWQFPDRNMLVHLKGNHWKFHLEQHVSLTFWYWPRPSSIILTRNDRLTLHHVLWVAIELDNVSSFVRRSSLSVSIRWLPRVEALNFRACWERSAPLTGWQTDTFWWTFQAMARWAWERRAAANFSAYYGNTWCSSVDWWWNWNLSALNAWKKIFGSKTQTLKIQTFYFRKQEAVHSNFHWLSNWFLVFQSKRYHCCKKTELLFPTELRLCLKRVLFGALFHYSEQPWLQQWLRVYDELESCKCKLLSLVLRLRKCSSDTRALNLFPRRCSTLRDIFLSHWGW